MVFFGGIFLFSVTLVVSPSHAARESNNYPTKIMLCREPTERNEPVMFECEADLLSIRHRGRR